MDDNIRVTDLSQPGMEEDSLSPVQKQVLKETNPPTEYTLSNGTKVLFKKVSGIIASKIARYLGQESMNPGLNLLYKMAFCISEINGKQVRQPASALEVEALLARFGDEEFLDEAQYFYGAWIGLFPDPTKKATVTEGDEESEEENPVKKS